VGLCLPGSAAGAQPVEVQVAPARTGEVVQRIGELGGRVDAVVPGMIDAHVAPDDLAGLNDAPGVQLAAHVPAPVPQAVTGSGVSKSGADIAQAAGATGAGVKIGIIDNGFLNYEASVASGDLPSDLVTQDYCSPGGFTSIKHGTAVAEVVHEMAPAAKLYLICATSNATIAQAEQYAISQGITIMNHSASSFYPTRGDGTGPPGTEEATIADARQHGILWVQSGGNYANIHWGGNASGDGDDYVDFTPGDDTNRITIPAGGQVCPSLKWDAFPTTTKDFDLELRTTGGTLVTPSSFVPDRRQFGSGDVPWEYHCYTNTSGASTSYDIKIFNYSKFHGQDPGPVHLDLFISNEGVGSMEHAVASGSVTEPATAPQTFAVAAICPLNNSLQSYSSQGPTIDGRIKPDIAGYGPVNSTSYGNVTGSGCTGGFGGTSSASPHVAGAAALYAQGQPGASPDTLRSELEASAADLGTLGKDNLFGAGALTLRPSQPDLLIKGKGKTIGDGSYGKGQVAKRKLRAGGKTSFSVTVQNDGFEPGPFLLRAKTGDRGLRASFIAGGKNVTKSILKGRFSAGLLPGQSLPLKVKLHAVAGTHGSRRVTMTARNGVVGTIADTVAGKLKIKG